LVGFVVMYVWEEREREEEKKRRREVYPVISAARIWAR